MIRVNIPFLIWFILISIAKVAIGGILFNTAFIMTFIILCLCVVNAIIQNIYFVAKLDFEDKDYFAGDNICLKLKLLNKAGLLLSNVNITNNYFNYSVYCNPFSNNEFEQDIVFDKKGLYTIENFNMIMTDIFGVITVKKSISVNRNIEVYPKVTEYSKALKSVIGYQKYDKDIRKIENITQAKKNDIKDFRLYMPGDNLKRVHWKLSAKRGKLFVKEYEHTNESNFNIFVDLTRVSAEDYIKYDNELASKVVSIINHFLKTKCSIRLFINDEAQTFIPVNSYSDFSSVLEYFMNTEYYSSHFNINFDDARRYFNGNILVLLFDPMEDIVLDESKKAKANVIDIYKLIGEI